MMMMTMTMTMTMMMTMTMTMMLVSPNTANPEKFPVNMGISSSWKIIKVLLRDFAAMFDDQKSLDWLRLPSWH